MVAARNFVLLALMALSAACAQLGLATPETFNQRLAAGYAAVTQVRQSATTLLKAKRLSVSDAQNVQRQADNAREALDIARALGKSDPKGGEEKLRSVRTALSALQSYLASKEAP